ncbi:hypothetical protein BC829DRAFT_291314 [Chytridium lagenaria]|nr:hypothetical protein BC829DRAFT_291314 [Chytridium lagenaria]
MSLPIHRLLSYTCSIIYLLVHHLYFVFSFFIPVYFIQAQFFFAAFPFILFFICNTGLGVFLRELGF